MFFFIISISYFTNSLLFFTFLMSFCLKFSQFHHHNFLGLPFLLNLLILCIFVSWINTHLLSLCAQTTWAYFFYVSHTWIFNSHSVPIYFWSSCFIMHISDVPDALHSSYFCLSWHLFYVIVNPISLVFDTSIFRAILFTAIFKSGKIQQIQHILISDTFEWMGEQKQCQANFLLNIKSQ